MEVEKLCKLLETLAKASSSAASSESSLSPGGPNSANKRSHFIRRRTLSKYPSVREEKIHLCNALADSVSSVASQSKTAAKENISDVLGLALDALLLCCQDSDANTRLAAEEILNRVLHEHVDSHPVTVLVDLFKHVKKNEDARCVRVAWSRFAHFAVYLRPQRFRCRAFVLNLIPCIVQLSRRDEDTIHEALAGGLPLVLKPLGPFITETEIKALVRVFLPNLSSESSTKRRTAAAAVVELCLQSRKPDQAMEWLVRGLLGLIRTSPDNATSNSFCGILLAIKHALSAACDHHEGHAKITFPLPLNVQILIALLSCCSNKDHNVQGFALETLHIFLRHLEDPIRDIFCQTGGLANFQHSPGESGDSFEFGPDEADHSELTSPDHRDGEILDPEHFGSVDNPMLARNRASVDLTSDKSDTMSVLSGAMSEDVLDSHRGNEEGNVFESDDEESPSTELADTFSEDAFTDKDGETGLEGGGSEEGGGFSVMGSLYDVGRSGLEFVARFICGKFLLKEGFPVQIRPSIRASVQSMALSCLTDLVHLDPALLFKARSITAWDDDESVGGTYFADVCSSFLGHDDPLLKAHGAVLACLLSSATVNPLLTVPEDLPVQIDSALFQTAQILREESAAACRLAVEALEKCMEVFLFTEDYVDHALNIVLEVMALLTDPRMTYWLLKTELLRFLRAVPFTQLFYAETVCRNVKQERTKVKLKQSVLHCLFAYLGHDDHRIRQAAAESLCWLPYSFGLPVLISQQTFSVLRANYEQYLKGAREDLMHSMATGQCFPYNAHEFPRYVSGVEDNAALVIGKLFDLLICSTKKDQMVGLIVALCHLSRIYPTTSYSRSWFGVIEDNDLARERYVSPAVGLLSRVLEIMRSTSFSSDLLLHACALELAGNLFSGLAVAVYSPSARNRSDGVPWSHLACHGLRQFADSLSHHLARLLNLTKAVVEGQKMSDVFGGTRSALTSPAATLSIRHRHDSFRRGEKKSKIASLDFRGKPQLGGLTSQDIYGSLMESLKKAYHRHRTHLSHDTSTNRFRHLIKACLTCFSQILEMTAADFISPFTDELLRYLKTTMTFEGQVSVYAIQQLLRCLFGCNLAQMDSGGFFKEVRGHFEVLPAKMELLVAFVEDSPGGCFLPRFLTMPGKTDLGFDGNDWMTRWSAYLESRRVECLEVLFKSYTKEKRLAMSDTIRQFETVVIKSLQLYTCTVQSSAQMQMLDLLVLLLQLHVNYNVLDGDHVFLKYILKQLELVEMGQIVTPPPGQRLFLYLFRFLIHLSHDKVIFQQNILTYGHIMQYCDSLMAVTAPSQKMVLSILRLLFEDAVYRKTVTIPAAVAAQEMERDAQLEVILATALRCLPESNALDIICRFLMHQLAKSAGLYEQHVRDLVDGTFSRILPAGLSGATCLSRFGKDYDRISHFLRIVGCHELLHSQAFLNFFAELVGEVRKSSDNNLGALLFFAAIIDQFVRHGVIDPLLKLFHLSDQNHPLANPLGPAADISAQGFALVITHIFDALFESNTSFSIDADLQQVLDFIYCSLLRTLTSFIGLVEHGPVKTTLREIQSTNRLDFSERRHINTACRVAWLQFRFAATGCDLEPRFWNKGIKLPIEDHICEVVWDLIRPERESLAQPEESRRLVNDIAEGEVSALELLLINQAHFNNGLDVLKNLLKSCRSEEDEDVTLRWLMGIFSRPRGLTILTELIGDLKSLSRGPESGVFKSFNPNSDERDRIGEAWSRERPSEVKDAVLEVIQTPGTPKQTSSTSETSENTEIWLQSLARKIALSSPLDSSLSVSRLLQKFDEETIMTIVTDQRFSLSLLRDCLRPSSPETPSATWSTTPSRFTPLFYAARFALLQAIGSFVQVDWETGDGIDEHQWLMLTGAFLELVERINEVDGEFPLDSMDDFLQLIMLGFRITVDRCCCPRLVRRRVLQCLLLCLENGTFTAWLRDQPETTVAGLVEEIFGLLVVPVGVLAVPDQLQEEINQSSDETREPGKLWPFVARISGLASLLDSSDHGLTELEADVILGLSRLPIISEIIRIPPSAHAFGWTGQAPSPASPPDPIPIELLQELSILKELIGRVCRFGWTSKRQFEETWMAFLSVLSCVPLEEESQTDEAQHEHSVSSRIATGRMALRCITALLLESVLAVRPGNPLRRPRVMVSSKESPYRHLDAFLDGITTRRTMAAADFWPTHFLCRPRRASYFHYTHFDGLDQLYCRWIMKGSPQAGPDSQVDLRSCLKFVMDLYSHWTSDERLKKLSPYILDEVVKSTLHISNIFHEEKNFRWMYVFVRQVLRIKNVEESHFYGHLIEALGKSLSFLNEDKEALSTLRKAAESRATQSLMNRLSSSRMILRLIRQQTPGESHKMLLWLQSLSTSIYEFECRSRIRNGYLLDLLFTIFVTQIDVFLPKAKDTGNPFNEVLLQELRAASSLSYPMLSNLVLVLGRYLVDKRVDDGVFREQLVKTGLDLLNVPPPRSLCVLGLLLTCLDPDMRGGLQGLLSPDDNSPSIADSHSDPLFVMAMEKMAIVKQRRAKSFLVESDLLGNLYLHLLVEKTPLHEAINRVMAEFQSCPASSAPSVAELVSQVFTLLKRHRLDAVIDEWIALSLGNFAHRVPSGLGIWSLTCLFCAASSGSLSLLFPFLRLRCGISDDILRHIFLHSGLSFFRDIEVAETAKIFRKAVATAAGSSDAMEQFARQLTAFSPG